MLSSRPRDVTPERRMADASTSVHLMKNVQDLRKRLLDTEKNLKTLTQLESEDVETSVGLRDYRSSRQLTLSHSLPDTMQLSGRRGSTDDYVDRESIRSGLSTLPDSYTGFFERQFPASTPNRPQTYSRQPYSDDSQSGDQVMLGSHINRSRSQPDDTSSKVMRQNHRLLSEVERLAYELQSANSKNRELMQELEGNTDIIPELEDKIEGLQAETEAQDKAMRTAEERYEECQRTTSHMQVKLKQLQQDVSDLRTELNTEKKLRKSTERQRDETLQNFLESEQSLATYQKRMNEKIKIMEEAEDYLRDMVSHVTHERDELISRTSRFESVFDDQEKELQRLQTMEAVELETKNDMEEQNMQMRDELDKLKSAIIKLQEGACDIEDLRQENVRLKTNNQKQQQELNVCQQEVEEARTMLVQLEMLAQQVQQNQSSIVGNVSADSGVYSSQSHRYNTSLSSVNRGNSSCAEDVEFHSLRATKSIGGARTVVADLRMQLHSKDSEIQRLRSSLQSLEQDTSSAVLESLRAELNFLIEKSKQECRKTEEMEVVVVQLEAEKSRLASQLMDLKRDLSDKDSQTMSLDSRITQRNTQIIELQEDINKKCTENNTLERELRKKTLKLSSLEEQLDEKMREFSTHIARMKQLEEEVICREEENRIQEDQLELYEKELRKSQQSYDKLQTVHNDQCADYENQIDKLQNQLERKTSLVQEQDKNLISFKEELAEKTSNLHHTEQELIETKQELGLRTQQSEKSLQQLEHLSTEGKAQIKHLESSLMLCKEEIRSCVTNLQISQEQFDREVKLKEQQIFRLTNALEESKLELNEKTQENVGLEKSLLERQTMLQQATHRIAELEENQLQVNRQVSYLEQQVLRDKAQFMAESDTTERKLRQLCSDVEQKTADLADLTLTVRSLQDEKRRLLSDLTSAESGLRLERDDNDSKTDRLNKLEKDVRDLRVQLEQKIELVNDLEDQVASKEEDMQQQLQLVTDLESEVKLLQDNLKDSKQQTAKTYDELQRALFDVKGKEDMLDDLRDALRKTQEDLDGKCDELSEMQAAMDDRQRELQERMAQVAQLDHTIKDTHSEMEKRMHKLDSQLQKYEMEIDERTKQIADLDDSLQETQKQLRDRMLQLQQTEQLAQRQQLELQAKSAKLDELENVSGRQRQQVDDQREENVEITQELRLTREQLQHQHGEFMATRRELAQAHRERDRLAREMEESVAFQQSKETDTARLAEELGASQAREAQAEARLKAEVDRLKREIGQLKEKHIFEVEELNESRTTQQCSNEDLVSQLSAQAREVEQRESHYKQQLEKAQDDLDILHNELMSRKEVVDAANETIVIKESEIARLQARLSGYERAAISQLYSSQRAMQPTVGNIHSVAPNLVTQTASHNGFYNGYNSQNNSLSVEMENSFIHNGTSEIFDILHHQSSQLSRKTSEHVFQEMLLEASTAQAPDIPSSNCDLVKVLSFDNVSESDVAVPGGSKGQMLVNITPTTDSCVSKTDSCVSSKTNTSLSQDSIVSKLPLQTRQKRQGDFPVLHDDPYTAVGLFQNQLGVESSDTFIPEKQSEHCLVDLHERLRSNELQQQEIERQLQSLNVDDSADAEVAALT